MKMKTIESRLNDLEKRMKKLENLEKPIKKSQNTGPAKGTLPADLDELMQKHSKSFKGGIIFSGIAMPSENPNRLVRWSGAGGFKNDQEVEDFINKTNEDGISKFCSNFSSTEKLMIIKALIKDGPLNQKELLSLTKLSQGQFYHHVKDLINGKFVIKGKKDQYDITPMGHVLSLSFMGIINTFLK
jgi:hypothetical protein